MNGIDQTILDRLTTLERRVRGIDIGQELVLGNLTALGKVTAGKLVADNITVGATLYNVRSYGATGAGQPTNDYQAIKDTIDAAVASGGGEVVFPRPANKYYVYRGADNYIFNIPSGVSLWAPAGPNQTIIEAKEPRAIFRIGNVGNQQFFSIKGLYLTYDGYQGDNSHCLLFNDEGPGQDNNFILENLILATGTTGYYQKGNQWGGQFRNVIAYECRWGFIIDTNVFTTHKFDGCGAKGTGNSTFDLGGWYLKNGRNIVLDVCYMENYNADKPAQLDHCEGLTINGFHMERNACPPLSAIFFMANCRGYSLNGIRSAGNLLRVATPGHSYFIVDYSGANWGGGSMKGVFVGSDAGDYVYGDGIVYMVSWYGNVNATGQGLDVTNPHTVAELGFNTGSVEFAAYEHIKGATSGAHGYEVFHEVNSGSWGGGTATGNIYLRDVVGTFQANEDLVNFTSNDYRARAIGAQSQPAPTKWSLSKTASGGNVVISGSRYDTWYDPVDNMCDITGADGVTKTGIE